MKLINKIKLYLYKRHVLSTFETIYAIYNGNTTQIFYKYLNDLKILDFYKKQTLLEAFKKELSANNGFIEKDRLKYTILLIAKNHYFNK